MWSGSHSLEVEVGLIRNTIVRKEKWRTIMPSYDILISVLDEGKDCLLRRFE